ncbi:MAG: fluoride efflux transporter CrcB [Desulfobacteraceae bacterium]|jgi:fluoride exporter
MRNLLIVGMGGFCGAVMRYLVSGGVQKWTQSVDFPYGTLSVNLIGCLVIGMLTRLDEIHSLLTPEMRFFILIGLLGAFTTYSTFSNEAMNLINDRRFSIAVLYIAAHLVMGLLAVLAGRLATFFIWR